MRELVQDPISHSVVLAVETEELAWYGARVLAEMAVLESRFSHIILTILGDNIQSADAGTLAHAQHFLRQKQGELILVTEAFQIIETLETDGRASYPLFRTIKDALIYVFGKQP